MKKNLFILFMLSLLASLPSPAVAQSMSTMGTDFWVTFLNNQSDLYTGTKHRVFVSGANNCSVTVSNPITGWSTTHSVTQGQVTTINIPMTQSENTTSETVVNKGIHITSTDTISVYASTICTATYDVANILPTAALRNDYMILTYPSNRYPCLFAVVATQDSTTVDIILTNATSGGASAGDTLTVLLPQAGNVYAVCTPNYQSGDYLDFSGIRVRSRDCKPIAVFNGDECVYVPRYFSGQTCDLAYEQCVPTAYWGRNFIVPRMAMSHPDYVRVTALYDGCSVIRNGLTPVILNAGETYEYQLNLGVGDFISASSPVSVNMYFASVGMYNTGDPSMLTINPIEQMLHKVTFASYSTEHTNNHKVNVLLRTADKDLFTLDGVAHPSSFSTIPYNTTYSSAIFEVTEGSHTLEMGDQGAGFVAHAFGMGTRESYAYSVGSSLKNLGNSLYVNGVYVNPCDSVNGCPGNPFTFSVSHTDAINNVVWNFGDTTLVGDTVSYSFPSQGHSLVTAFLSPSASSCFGEYDTLSVVVSIFGPDTVRNLFEGCDSILVGNDVFRQNTIIVNNIPLASGCDSVVVNTFVVHPSSFHLDEQTITQYDTLLWIDGGYYWSEDQHPEVTLSDIYGCDSIVRLSLTVITPTPPTPPTDSTFAIDSSRLWIPNAFTPDEETNNRFVIYSIGIVEMTVHIYNRQGLHVVSFDGLTSGWDGTYHGKKCKQETYVYIVEYRTKFMSKVKQKRIGSVTLLR